MPTYINFNVPKHYVTFTEKLNPVHFEIGETWGDYLQGKWVCLTDEQLSFKNSNPNATLKDVFNMEIETSVISRTLETTKKDKIAAILRYDESEEVNCFYMQDTPMWLDKNTRTGLKLRFEAELAEGNTETSLWYENNEYSLPLENAIQMLYAIERYASKSYDNTQNHIANINKLETIYEIDAYDFTTNYPEKLRF